jgi:hypothetical protein
MHPSLYISSKDEKGGKERKSIFLKKKVDEPLIQFSLFFFYTALRIQLFMFIFAAAILY